MPTPSSTGVTLTPETLSRGPSVATSPNRPGLTLATPRTAWTAATIARAKVTSLVGRVAAFPLLPLLLLIGRPWLVTQHAARFGPAERLPRGSTGRRCRC